MLFNVNGLSKEWLDKCGNLVLSDDRAVCIVCGERFRSVQSCRLHMLEHAVYSLNHSCSICDQAKKCNLKECMEETVYKCKT